MGKTDVTKDSTLMVLSSVFKENGGGRRSADGIKHSAPHFLVYIDWASFAAILLTFFPT